MLMKAVAADGPHNIDNARHATLKVETKADFDHSCILISTKLVLFNLDSVWVEFLKSWHKCQLVLSTEEWKGRICLTSGIIFRRAPSTCCRTVSSFTQHGAEKETCGELPSKERASPQQRKQHFRGIIASWLALISRLICVHPLDQSPVWYLCLLHGHLSIPY